MLCLLTQTFDVIRLSFEAVCVAKVFRTLFPQNGRLLVFRLGLQTIAVGMWSVPARVSSTSVSCDLFVAPLRLVIVDAPNIVNMTATLRVLHTLFPSSLCVLSLHYPSFHSSDFHIHMLRIVTKSSGAFRVSFPLRGVVFRCPQFAALHPCPAR